MSREKMEYDVVIVGAGPAGLSCAIRLKQLCQEHQTDLNICIIEKGASVGAHIISGCVFEPRALAELFPDWQTMDTPVQTAVTEDDFIYLTEKRAFTLPTPKQMKNTGNFIISLSQLCRFLETKAVELGVEIYPGFAASELLINDDNQVYGIATGDMGIDKEGEKLPNYTPGIEIHARYTLLAEGCRGSLSEKVIKQFNLRETSAMQTYGLGVKEIWRVDPSVHTLGKVVHSIGWPLDNKTYGGSFMYHMENHQVAVGFVVGLDYQNPYLSPFSEMQRFKTHPHHQNLFENAERIAYGARALNEGGWQSIPTLHFPGGALIGDGAGFLNVPKIKGSHTAMKSGITCANALVEHHLDKTKAFDYEPAIKKSWVGKELRLARNIRPGFKWGLWAGLANAALETYVFRGRSPWTLQNHVDHLTLKKAENVSPITYPKPDNKITFDRLSSVYLSNTYHTENQPSHLTLQHPELSISVNLKDYDSPETRYCPAAVYEIVYTEYKEPRLRVNSQNCIHCKTCDIKDPMQNIVWETPEGGGGPNYTDM